MFFITRLTENTNLAASIPPSEQVFNAARVNILLVRPKFAELDIASKPRPGIQQAFAQSATESDMGSRPRVSSLGAAGGEVEGKGKGRDVVGVGMGEGGGFEN